MVNNRSEALAAGDTLESGDRSRTCLDDRKIDFRPGEAAKVIREDVER
jgi:hypothetical protein